MNLYFVPRRTRFADARALIELLRECYGVVRAGIAPLGIGLIYETARPIPKDEQETLGIFVWH